MRLINDYEIAFVSGAKSGDEDLEKSLHDSDAIAFKEMNDKFNDMNDKWLNTPLKSDPPPVLDPFKGNPMCPNGYEPGPITIERTMGDSPASVGYGKDGWNATLGGPTDNVKENYTCIKK